MLDEPKQDQPDAARGESDVLARRDFLAGLGKWSAVVIGGVALAGILGQPGSAEAGGWVNRRGYVGGGWVNGGGGGGGWANRVVGGGAWANRSGGGGGGWANRRGFGGAWANNR